MSSGIDDLRKELELCQQEVPEMEKLLAQIGDILDKKIATGDVVKKLEQQQKQLKKDIENYKHMLEEADDLRKSWDKEPFQFRCNSVFFQFSVCIMPKKFLLPRLNLSTRCSSAKNQLTKISFLILKLSTKPEARPILKIPVYVKFPNFLRKNFPMLIQNSWELTLSECI